MAFTDWATVTQTSTQLVFDFTNYRYQIKNATGMTAQLIVFTGAGEEYVIIPGSTTISVSLNQYNIGNGARGLRLGYGSSVIIQRESKADDPLQPGQVINQPYSIVGNGGRKLVRLSNGWLVSAARKTDGTLHMFKSLDDGKSWIKNPVIPSYGTINDFALVAIPGTTKVGFLVGHQNINLVFDVIDVSTWTAEKYRGVLDVNISAVGYMSITVDVSTRHLYAVWTSRTTAFPNSTNLRFAKSTDNGATWSITEQVTKENDVTKFVDYPSIVVANGKPFILARYRNSSSTLVHCYVSNGTSWAENRVHSQGTTYQLNGISAVVDKNGVIHVTWGAAISSDNYYHPMYSKSSDGIVWSEVRTLKPGNDPSITTDKNNKVAILATSPFSYLIQSNFDGNVWTDKIVPNTSSLGALKNVSTLYDNSHSISFDDTPPTIFQTANDIRYIGSYSANNPPSVTLTSPSNNQTLYENDTINISGDAYDADKDQSVTVFYQINGEQRKVLATNISQTQITLSKQLTFKDGKLYDSETVLTGTLAEGVEHKLKVWAVDSENGQSTTVERTFYVIPNRAPVLTVDSVEPAGVVDTDKFIISGAASDVDSNSSVKVTRRINNENPVEIYSGPGGAWEFAVSLSQLQVGENKIVIEVIDNYGAKVSKTIKLKKNEVKTPILHAVARYKIKPPAGSAKGVLLFIERDEDMDLKVELSMTLAGEQEQYETLTADNTAPMPNTNGIVEDTYYYEATEPKDNIILKLSTTRPDVTVNHKIHLISGAVE